MVLIMTDEQILQLAENHLTFEKWEDICWKTDTLQLLKFAKQIYRKGKSDGYEKGYDDGCFEATGGNG